MVSEVVNTVVENARRLLKDAELLFENKRYRSAAALAILSIEESGKSCVIRWREEGFIRREIQKDIRHFHFHKQRVLACFMFSEEILLASRDYYDEQSNVPIIKKIGMNLIQTKNFSLIFGKVLLIRTTKTTLISFWIDLPNAHLCVRYMQKLAL